MNDLKHFIMAEEKYEPSKDPDIEKSSIKPDPETLNTTDPQEHMKGPVSSVMQKIEEVMQSDDTTEKKKEE